MGRCLIHWATGPADLIFAEEVIAAVHSTHMHAAPPSRTRTCNLWLRGPMRYPLGHRAVGPEFCLESWLSQRATEVCSTSSFCSSQPAACSADKTCSVQAPIFIGRRTWASNAKELHGHTERRRWPLNTETNNIYCDGGTCACDETQPVHKINTGQQNQGPQLMSYNTVLPRRTARAKVPYCMTPAGFEPATSSSVG